MKMVPAGESTSANAGGLIPARERATGPTARQRSPPFPVRIGRTVYEQSCQVCHGPDLKGVRGPQIDNAVARLGEDSVRTHRQQRAEAACPLSLR